MKVYNDNQLYEVASWRPTMKFWSPELNFWSHWRPGRRNFRLCLVCVCSPSFLIPLFLDHCRYNEVFLIVDTCQAYSMTQKLYSPNILGVGSSLVGEDSLSVSSSLCTGTLIKFQMTVQSRTGIQDLSFKDWYFNRAKKIEFQLVFGASSSHILPSQGYFLLVLVNDFVRGWLAWTL